MGVCLNWCLCYITALKLHQNENEWSHLWFHPFATVLGFAEKEIAMKNFLKSSFSPQPPKKTFFVFPPPPISSHFLTISLNIEILHQSGQCWSWSGRTNRLLLCNSLMNLSSGNSFLPWTSPYLTNLLLEEHWHKNPKISQMLIKLPN